MIIKCVCEFCDYEEIICDFPKEKISYVKLSNFYVHEDTCKYNPKNKFCITCEHSFTNYDIDGCGDMHEKSYESFLKSFNNRMPCAFHKVKGKK